MNRATIVFIIALETSGWIFAADQGPSHSASPGPSPAAIETGHPDNSPAVPGPLPSDAQLPVVAPRRALQAEPALPNREPELARRIDHLQRQLNNPHLSAHSRARLKRELVNLQVKQMSQPAPATKEGEPEPVVPR